MVTFRKTFLFEWSQNNINATFITPFAHHKKLLIAVATTIDFMCTLHSSFVKYFTCGGVPVCFGRLSRNSISPSVW